MPDFTGALPAGILQLLWITVLNLENWRTLISSYSIQFRQPMR